ncbi:MAG: MBL fold metallo-hydrolase [Pseudomonadota bacterium]|nr:MBL fold metallo-hydrolase [Pseudomonadota bacterium]
MNHYICVQCGIQFSKSSQPPEHCPICEDERQFVNWRGQQWTTLEQMRTEHHNRIEQEGAELFGIGTEPSFAIGQRALLVPSSSGNLLWDCITLLDDQTIEQVNSLGSICAIAISHPHYYAAMIEWSEAFGDVPIYLHEADRAWVMRDDPRIQYWEGETHALWDELILINCGGHFDGGTVLHWPGGAEKQGALLTGDIIQVAADRRYVSFMRSYPNYIPLSARAIHRIQERVAPFAFERIYGAWWQRNVMADGKSALVRSAERYLCAIHD